MEEYLTDMSEIPAWCLLPVLEDLDPFKISQLAQTNQEIADVCTSQSLWEDKYDLKFEDSIFKISKSPDEEVDWISRYGKRHAISYNIANHKPKVKSFKGSEINKVRFFSNCFAFTSNDSLSIIAYDYFDKSCEYENIKTFKIPANDFIFVDENTIVTVNNDIVSMINVKTGEITEITKDIGNFPMIHRISPVLFAVITTTAGYIYDTRDIVEPRCRFKHIGMPVAITSKGNTLYIATPSDLAAHDCGHPRGPILWNVPNRRANTQNYCSFNTKTGYALFGNTVVKLLSGRIIVSDIINETIDCSCMLDNNIIILGCGEKVIYYDFQQKKQLGQQTFGEDEKIKHICSSSLNNRVAIAGDFTVHIVDPHYNDKGKFVVSEIRNPLKCGSVGMRRLDNFGIMKQVLFDGERIVANMGDFVRVYDFYTGKATDIPKK